MKISVLALAAASLAGAGCIVVHHDEVAAGDPLDAQLFLTWETQDAKTRAPLDCHSVGADTVRVSARNGSTGTVYTDLFDCDAQRGTTYSLTAGDYFINVDLVTCGKDSVCLTAPVVSAAPLVGHYPVWTDDELDLGHFVFLVD